MLIVAFDPGLTVTGYACIDAEDRASPGLVEAGHFALSSGSGAGPREATPGGEGGGSVEAARWGPRLVELRRDAGELLDRLRPASVAVEAVFAHRDHPRAAVAMAHARGVLLLCASERGLPVVELAPASVKKSLTGLGNASKDQVAAAVGQVLGLDELPTPRDVTDAMAIAIAAAARS